jgi:hypothetical protein
MTPVDIKALHTAIKTQLAAQFTGTTVEEYQRTLTKVTVPAILFESPGWNPGEPDNSGTGQAEVVLDFSAYCIIGFKTPRAHAEARALAASVYAFILGKRWGQSVGAAKVGVCEPDDFSFDNADDYSVMRIDWTHEAVLGASVWTNEGVPKEEVWVGYAPEIGPPNVADYEKVQPQT